MAERVRVVIVDDHSIFRSGLKADLDDTIEVVGEAHDVETAVTAVTDAAPDVVLLDVHLPGVAVPAGTSGGAEVIRRAAASLRQAQDGAEPATRFLALSVSDKAEDVVGVIRAGARGYITKGSSGADVSRAVHAVSGGDAVFSPKLAGFVLDAFGAAVGETASASDELDRLSAREQEVMRLIARGYAYKEVAAELFISTKTVETHVSAVLRKLQLSSRHELTAWANARRLL
ncbi:LuxR family transcriptional regulator [Agromyces sp. Root81]|uniref:LuxR C-terminal-related transcriptional regulator n=1 Tax=Agromyces sp. Root81 TaxID=1736601 RepID=UPI0006FD2688|nr:response regulator transcription factor [Agromyces sp. Root81]KRC61971.1 LuxR family transcriptional regulator [Agromyces sp. Root81]